MSVEPLPSTVTKLRPVDLKPTPGTWYFIRRKYMWGSLAARTMKFAYSSFTVITAAVTTVITDSEDLLPHC